MMEVENDLVRVEGKKDHDLQFRVLSDSPPSFLLSLDEDTLILLDCGLSLSSHSDQILEIYREIGPKLSVILLSHPDIYHIGYLPYICSKCNIKCPIYATTPIYKMGQLFLYDFYESHYNYMEFDLFNLDDVDDAFEKVIQVKYLQSATIGKLSNIKVMAQPAGHMIGSSIWKITQSSGENIIYAINCNHRSEHHLDPGSLSTITYKPSVLISDLIYSEENTMGLQSKTRKESDKQLISDIQETLRSGGNVMIPTDTSGRLLEIAYILNKEWSKIETGLVSYNLVLLNPVAYNILEFAKAHVEWCGKKVVKEVEQHHRNPFDFSFITSCHSLNELKDIEEPFVVLASSHDLESGFSRELLENWVINPNNSIIITRKAFGGSDSKNILVNKLIKNPNMLMIPLTFYKREKVKDVDQELDYSKNLISNEKNANLNDKQKFKDSQGFVISSEHNEIDFSKKYHNPTSIFSIKQYGNPFLENIDFLNFSYNSKKVRWDDYGELLNIDDILKSSVDTTKEKDDDEMSNVNDNFIKSQIAEAQKIMGKEFDDFDDKTQYNYFSYIKNLDIKCKIKYIDFNGMSNIDSFKKILARIRPEKLVITSGSEHAILSMKEFCTNNLSACELFTPDPGSTISLGSDLNHSLINLSKTMMNELSFKDISGTKKIARFCANINQNSLYENSDLLTALPITNRNAGGNQLDLLSLKQNLSSDHLTSKSADKYSNYQLFFLAPKLSELKTKLTKDGLKTEFKSGSLVIQNSVSLRKKEGNNYILEGVLCPEYFQIRRLLYSKMVVL